MLVASDFRAKAREALSGKWGVAVGTGFIASILGAYTALGNGGGRSSSSSNLSTETKETLQSTLSDIPDEVWLTILGVIALLSLVMLIWSVAMGLIGGAVTLGYVKFNLNLIDGKAVEFSDLFSQFNRFGQAFLMQLLRGLFIFLWTLLLIIPGIIATYSYAMTPYILYENPDMSASDAIRKSKELMKGNKWRLFCLNFSFFGWAVLCIFTCGIGFLWLKPYQEAAFAAFYRDLQPETVDYVTGDFTSTYEPNNFNQNF